MVMRLATKAGDGQEAQSTCPRSFLRTPYLNVVEAAACQEHHGSHVTWIFFFLGIIVSRSI